MSEHLKHRLRKQGWTKSEISHLSKHLKHVKKSTSHKVLEIILSLFILLFAILISLSVSFFLIFLFIIVKPTFVYILAGLFGLIFGMLFEVTLRHIDWIEVQHHFVGGVVIFLVILLNLFIFSPGFISRIPLFTLVNLPLYGSLIVGGVYFLGFSLPFVFHKVTTKKFY